MAKAVTKSTIGIPLRRGRRSTPENVERWPVGAVERGRLPPSAATPLERGARDESDSRRSSSSLLPSPRSPSRQAQTFLSAPTDASRGQTIGKDACAEDGVSGAVIRLIIPLCNPTCLTVQSAVYSPALKEAGRPINVSPAPFLPPDGGGHRGRLARPTKTPPGNPSPALHGRRTRNMARKRHHRSKKRESKREHKRK